LLPAMRSTGRGSRGGQGVGYGNCRHEAVNPTLTSGAPASADRPGAAVPAHGVPGGPDWGFGIVIGFLNFCALWFLIAFTGMFLTRGSPAATNYGYPPPWACLLGAIGCGGVQVLTVAVLIRRHITRARERQATDSEIIGLLQQTVE
jgi:hypothetical protein